MRPQIALLLVLALAPVARATTVTIEFSGYVTNVGKLSTPGIALSEGAYPPLSISAGDLFSATYTYDDSLQADVYSTDSHQIFYFDRDHPISMTVAMDGESYLLDGNVEQPRFPGTTCTGCSYLVLTNTNQVIDGQLLNWYDVYVADSQGLAASVGLTRDPRLSDTGILGDAPIPDLPAVGGGLFFVPNPSVLVSGAHVVDGQITGPGTVPIFLPSPDNPRVRTWQKTQLPAVYKQGDYVQGQITSFSVVPEPWALGLWVLGLGGLALYRRAPSAELS